MPSPSLRASTPVLIDRENFFININHQVESYLDASGSFDPNQPQNALFEHRNTDFGRVDHPVWLRFSLHNQTSHELPLFIWMVDYNLDHIELYHKSTDGSFRVLGRLSAIQKFAERYQPTKDYVFPITLAAQTTQEYYIKVYTEGLISVPLRVISTEEYQKRQNLEYSLFGIFYGAILVMLLYNGLLFLGLRDMSILSFIGYLICLGVFSLTTNGIGFQYFWPNSTIMQTNGITFSATCMGAFICDFSRRFLNLRTISSKLDKTLRFMTWFLFVFAAASLFTSRSHTMEIMMMLDFIGIIICISASIRAIVANYHPARHFILGWLAFFSGAIYLMIASLGFVETSLFSLYGMFIGAFVQMGFLAFAMSERLKVIQKEFSTFVEIKNAELQRINSGLEDMVRERTRTIRHILDNVKNGFFMIDSKGLIQPGFTESCKSIVSSDFNENVNIMKILATVTSNIFQQLRLAIDQIFSGMLPEDVSLSQIPKRVELNGKILSLEGSVIRNNDQDICGILFSVNDISELREIERQKEIDEALIKILKRKWEFDIFLNYFKEECDRCKSLHPQDKYETEFRSFLHTVKGNAAIFCLTPLVMLIHKTEEQATISHADLQKIECELMDFLKDNEEILGFVYGMKNQEMIEIALEHLNELQSKVFAQNNINQMKNALDSWVEQQKMRSFEELIRPLIESTQQLAHRQQKKVAFAIENGQFRINPEKVKALLINISHVFRNAIDHGVEAPSERGSKSEIATIRVGLTHRQNSLSVTITDDGCGINTDLLLKKAISAGIITEEIGSRLSHSEKCRLILESNLSTSAKATDISGRGIGMAAVRESVIKVGGSIDIDSDPGLGTSIIINWPN